MAVEKVIFTENDDIVLAEKPLPLVDVDIRNASAENIVEVDNEEGAVERFLAKMRQFRNYPPAQFTYHAFGNLRNNWTPEKAKILIDYAREHGLEIRAWAVEESGINLIVLKDPDSSEDSGMEIYEKMQGNFDSYGLASWYEFDKWGVPLCTDEDVEIGKLNGIWGIKIGKGNEWVSLS